MFLFKLFISYGPVFDSNQRKRERQSILKNVYSFTCNCEACKNNWLENYEDPLKRVSSFYCFYSCLYLTTDQNKEQIKNK